MTECSNRSPNKARLIQTMDIDTLLAYAKMHISMDSQDLIDELVSHIEARIKKDHNSDQEQKW